MGDKKRITDRYTDNANDFDRIVVDTFKIIEEQDKIIQELAAGLNDIADYLDINKLTTIGSTSIFHREARELADKYLK